MSSSSNELSYFEAETRLRAIVSDLIAPVIQKSSEHEVIIKNLLSSTKQTDESIKNFESLLTKSVVKMVPNEEFNKKLLEIISEKRSTDTVFHMKIESIGSRVDFMNHQSSDLASRVRNLEEIQKHLRNSFDDLTTTFREVKEKFSDKIEKVEQSVMAFGQGDDQKFEAIEEKIKVEKAKIEEINLNAFPEIVKQVEMQMKILREVSIEVRELGRDRVEPGDLKKLRNHLEFEVKKNRSHADAEVHNLREYLDKMLRVEISCGISDTLLQVLDPRQIKKLIPVAETQMAPTAEDQGPAPAASLTTALLSKKTLDNSHKIEEKIVQAKRRLTKEFDKPFKLASIKKLEIENIDSPPKTMAESGASTAKREHETKRIETKHIDSPVKEMSPLVQQAEESPKKLKISKKKSDKSSLNTDKSIESFSQVSQISLDPIWVQEQINQLAVEIKIAIQTSEEVKNIMKSCLEAMKLKVEEAHKEFSSTVLILNEEIKLNSKLRLKDLSDVQSYLNENIEKINERIVKLDNNDSKIVKLNEIVLAMMENEKVIFELIAQDEEDRKNLQLMGYAEGKTKKIGSKLSVSLKPECLSCTGENPLIYSAFKMACLSYNPSDLKYNSNLFTRKALIDKLGEMVYGKWSSDDFERIRSSLPNDYSSGRIKSHQRTRTTSKQFLDFTITKLMSEHATPHHSRRDIKYFKAKQTLLQ